MPIPLEVDAEIEADAGRWRGLSDLFDGYAIITIERLAKNGSFEIYGDDVELGVGRNIDKVMDKIIKEDKELTEG